MDNFSVKLQIMSVSNTETPGDYSVVARVIDNTGVFTASDVSVGDTVYLDGNALALGALRYTILSVSNVVGINFTCHLVWQGAEEDDTPPFVGATAIIGYTDVSGITTLSSMTFTSSTSFS